MPKLTTGNADLNSLLGGGIEPGHFYLFYGDNKSVDLLIHQILVNCLLPEEKYGFDGKAVYSNCGNYREEKTLLDSQLLSFLIKAAKLDPMKALDNIYVICAFSGEQQEQIESEVQKLLEEDKNKIKLVVVHNIAKLFTSDKGRRNKNFERITKLQRVVLKLWQACAQNNIAFVASCRSNKTSRGRIPQPEGGKYLRHEANVIVHLSKKSEKPPFITAYLLKHPNRASRKIDFAFTAGGDVVSRITLPFRTILREEMNNLKRSYRETLLDASRRDAFDSLLKAWSSEQESMSYAKVPTVLDVMLLIAVIDNRKLIEDLFDPVGIIGSKIDMIQKRLERVVD
jgi:RecA/RadA recombinase